MLAGLRPAELSLQKFWNQLESVESLSTFGTTRFLDLGDHAYFPHEGSDVQSKLLARQCYEDLSKMVHDHFADEDLVFIIARTPGELSLRSHSIVVTLRFLFYYSQDI